MESTFPELLIEADMPGWALGCSRPGAAHRRTGTPCQDAYALWSGAVAGSPCLVAAVADGHGAARYDRSHYGAALAVQAAVDEARALALHGHSDAAFEALKHDFKIHFPRKVGQRWHDAVRDDAQWRDGDQEAAHAPEPQLFTRYGTTLLVALVVSDTVFVGQIGDGEILLVTPADDTCVALLRRPDALLGTETYSLCSADAPQLWQTADVELKAPGLLLMTTDGLSDALGAEEATLFRFARSLCQRLQDYGVSQVAAALPGWLDHYSTHGSGDDMTLALAWLGAGTVSSASALSDESEEPLDESSYRTAGDDGPVAECPDDQTEAW